MIGHTISLMCNITNMWTLCFRNLLHKLVLGFKDIMTNNDNLGFYSTLLYTIKMQLYCVITFVISKVGMRRKLVLTHGFQESRDSPQINVENFALQNRQLHYGINRILELCVLELCKHLCSIFKSRLSLLIVKLYTLFKLFIIPVSSFRNKVLIYSRIILCTC